MKAIVIAAAAVLLAGPAMAQSVGGLGFTPPSTVPTYNNLGGVLGGVGTGVTAFTLTDVRTIPALNQGGTQLQGNFNSFIISVRPVPVQPVP